MMMKMIITIVALTVIDNSIVENTCYMTNSNDNSNHND